MSERIRVVIVDDHAVVREGLRSFLQLQPDIDVVGEAADGQEAVRVASAVQPQVILLDLVMPKGDGLAALRALRQAVPGARILVLTSFADDAHVFPAVQAGAHGYLFKDVQPEALADAIRQLNQGLPALHPQVAARLMHHAMEPVGLAGFTTRERDVLRLLVAGFANKEIGQRLHISEKTVKTHVSNILQKLGVQDRTQAAVLALRRGLVD